MKQLFKRLACLLALGMVLAMSAPFAALAAEAPYTYTVTLSMGRHGTYSHTGISVGLSDANILPTVTATDSMITISNLAKGSRVNLGMDTAALDADGKYYVQGVRISGRDNNTATVPSFAVTEDADYVMAYGIKGDLTQYTVNYQDTDGNALAPSRIYYGNVGDKPVVAYLYIDGYQPRSYNLTKTLVANSAENVFTFVYSRLSGGGNGGNGSGTGTGGTGTGTGTGDGEGGTTPPQDIIIYIPAPGGTTRPTTGNNGGNGGGNNGGNNTATTDDDENADTEEEQPAEEVVEVVPAPNPGNGTGNGNNGGNNGANNGAGTGEETLGDGAPEELTDIDANRTPLANIVRQIVETVSNASPVALAGGGIAIAAVVGLLIFLLVARKKKKKDEDNASDEQSGDR